MRQQPIAWIAWTMAAAVIAISGLLVVDAARSGEFERGPESVVPSLIEVAIAPIFALLGALIISNRPRNIIGWLITVPALASGLVGLIGLWTSSFDTAPEVVSTWLLLALWLESWSWLLFMFPIFHLLQVFPTGRVLTPRWRWLALVELGMFVTFVGLVTFSSELSLTRGDNIVWTVENPIGFVPETFWESGFSSIWTLGLLTLVLGGAASTVVRFRRSRAEERQQLKWLLYALVLFAAVYAATAVVEGTDNLGAVFNVLFLLSVTSIPVVMTMAVLRYRLFDIDLIIRKTLVYGLLTGLLTAVYFGSVVALQSVFRGEGNSSITVAASTLLITASFTPLRRRIQSLIDRRLFRSKYNAQIVIERFGGTAQHQSNLETLSADLLAVVGEIIQPRSEVLWIREPSQATAKA